jgi:hypothetical protein
MAHSNNILQELNELESSLASLPVQSTYSVPEGYFEGLAQQVLNRVKAMEAGNAGEELTHLSPVLKDMSKKMPYMVPAGYFDELGERMLDMVKSIGQTAAEELQQLSPLLGSLKKEMPFNVPQGYFETVAIPQTEEKPAAKVVSLSSRKWFKYAAAAMIIGVISTLFVIIKKSNVDPNKNPGGWVAKQMKNVSTDDINNFIELTDETLPQKEVIASAEKKEEVKQLLQDVSDKEIQEFLDELPVDETITADDEAMMN